MDKILVHAQHSGMHNTLVHAQEPSLGPKKGAVQGLGPAQCSFWVPGLVPVHAQGVLCMHKNLVHVEES